MGCGVGSMPHSYESYLARLYRPGPTSTLVKMVSATKPDAIASKITIPMYGLTGQPSFPSHSWCSCRRRNPGQRVDQLIHRVAVVGIGQIGEQLQREPHQGSPGQPVRGADAHHPRMTDQLDEGATQRVVPAELSLQPGRVRLQGPLRGRAAAAPLVCLGHRCRRDLCGLQGVRDAFAVERVDHATGITDQQQATSVMRLAVESHRERSSPDRSDHVLTPKTPVLRSVLQPALEQILVVGLPKGS